MTGSLPKLDKNPLAGAGVPHVVAASIGKVHIDQAPLAAGELETVDGILPEDGHALAAVGLGGGEAEGDVLGKFAALLGLLRVEIAGLGRGVLEDEG